MTIKVSLQVHYFVTSVTMTITCLKHLSQVIYLTHQQEAVVFQKGRFEYFVYVHTIQYDPLKH